MNSSLKIVFILLSQIMFAQENIIIETPFSKGIIFGENSIAKGLGEFIADKKEIIAFENTLQKVIKEINAGDTLYLPKHILKIDFSNYYRGYIGMDSDRKKRILVIFIPKEKLENFNDSITWNQLYETSNRFNVSYFLDDNKVFFPVKCEN
jgi:hypothetical protein